MHTGGASYYYTLDQQGSVIALTDSSQALAAAYSYDPWGNPITATGPKASTNAYRYATGYYDTTTGYLKLGARYYNPTTGRFTQPDPNTTWGNYPYAAEDPMNKTDPTVRSTCGDWSLNPFDNLGSLVDCASNIGTSDTAESWNNSGSGCLQGGVTGAGSAVASGWAEIDPESLLFYGTLGCGAGIIYGNQGGATFPMQPFYP